MKTGNPNYIKIFEDILIMKYPEKLDVFQETISKKEELSYLEVMELNNQIFGISDRNSESQKYRSYDRNTILSILDFQRKKRLNNSELASHFKLSRNTIAK